MKLTKSITYVVVTPVRDEASNIHHTIESFANQTILPKQWVVIDDGSTDATGQIADEAARKYPWITVIHRRNRGFRKTGGGVIEAFYDGYELVQNQSWDFIAKMDADLGFAADYFERCFEIFEKDPKLGLGGGLVWEHRDGRLVVGSAGDPAFHVRGATKVYRRECWQQIGGLIKDLGWDTVDELKANMLGWRTYTFRDLRLTHYKPTGAADGVWGRLLKAGRANYVTGYHPLFMVLKCIKRLTRRPYCVGSLGLWLGFVSGYLKRAPKVADEPLIRWVREQQLRQLCLKSSLWRQKSVHHHPTA